MTLAEDMIGDLWEQTKDDDDFFSALPGLPGLPPPPGKAAAAAPSPLRSTTLGTLGGPPLGLSADPVFDAQQQQQQLSPSDAAASGGSSHVAPPRVAWPSVQSSASAAAPPPAGRPRSGSGSALPSPPSQQPAQQQQRSGLPASAAASAGGGTGGAKPGRGGKEEVALQDPTKEWRCKCGTMNKAGTHLCASRSCHCYFCLGCGQLGHQQRFCRQASAIGPAGALGLRPGGRGARPDGLGGDEGGVECVVCMDAVAQVTLSPCGHNITCQACTRALIQLKRPCPFCSAPIKSTDIDRIPDTWRTA